MFGGDELPLQFALKGQRRRRGGIQDPGIPRFFVHHHGLLDKEAIVGLDQVDDIGVVRRDNRNAQQQRRALKDL